VSVESGNGLVIGIVSGLDDPEALARVEVTYPYREDQVSGWARLVTPMGGKQRGLLMRPEVGDEVLVGYEQGDPRRPYILGAVWSSADNPPPDDGQPTQNNLRLIHSRSGHRFVLDDTSGGEQIVIVDKDGTRKIVIDSAGQSIQITCGSGDISLNAPTGQVSISAQSISIQADAEIEIQAGAALTLTGATISINDP
jgi:uncharacterized protein involved in type VI secretion and phage assembly